ncbi:MAG: hypothetical protein M3418_01880, partial [Gemmatimonadota bacterium]|nr:hypothetical protein [Gemmatimonadota bacterium]
VVGRLPAVLAGVGLVVAVFAWLRQVAGRGPAWVAAVLLSFSPGALYLSQQVRFYPLQALLFWLGAVAAYRLAYHSSIREWKAVLLGGAGVAFLLALHLQTTTAVGVAGVLVWVLLVRSPAVVRYIAAHRHRVWIWSALAAAAVLLITGALVSGAPDRAVSLFQYADLWAESNRENVRYYHWLFLDQYATLWTLLPLWILIAWVKWPRPAAFCVVIFITAFVFHSLAAWKQERYIFYALPFFFAVSAMGLAQFVGWVWSRVGEALIGVRGLGRRGSRAISAALLLGAALFAAIGNGAFAYAYRMLTVPDSEWDMDKLYRGEPDWTSVAPILGPIADSSAVVVTSTELKALYYLGRLDVLLNANYLANQRGVAPEFAPFAKHNRPVISTPESLQRVIDCFPSGLVVVERGQWRRPWGVLPAAADLLEQHTTTIALPESSRLRAFRWSTPAGTPMTRCPPIAQTVGIPTRDR